MGSMGSAEFSGTSESNQQQNPMAMFMQQLGPLLGNAMNQTQQHGPNIQQQPHQGGQQGPPQQFFQQFGPMMFSQFGSAMNPTVAASGAPVNTSASAGASPMPSAAPP